jgi:hypothetical protein
MTEQLDEQALRRGGIAMEQVAATHARLSNIVIPIYAEKDNKVLYLEASAFLLRIKDAVFLVTASHTLRAYANSPFWVPAGGKPFGLNALFSHTKIEGAVDLAFARLDERMDPLLAEYRILTLDDIDVEDWPEPNHIYTFIGYPSSMNKANLKTKTLQPTMQPYSSHKPLLLDEYPIHDLNPCSAIAVYFDLSKAEREGTGEVVQPKSPVGISGGPVFRIGQFQELYEGTNREKVVGLGVGYEYKPDRLVGARISLVIEGIRLRHSDLADALPTNPRCAFNVTVI